MTTHHLVDPELLPLLGLMPTLSFCAAQLPDIRAAFAQQLAAVAPPLPGCAMREILLAREGAPALRLLAYRPLAADGVLPAIYHIHGGGYVIGTADMMDEANRALALELQCAIFSVDYRLAPETPHPGPIEDCYAGLAWVHANAASLAIDPARIGVKGESAGGGLAASLALLARDRGDIPLAFQHLIYPMLDDRTCTHADPHPGVGAFLWTMEHNRFGWSALLNQAPGAADISAYAAAARAADLAGLPPAFISVGALDLFLEEDIEYARRLGRSGVAVELHVYPGAFHGFDMAPATRVAIASAANSAASLRRALHG